LWEKHPYWTAMMMRRAMRETASQHATPDTIRGWGIINTAAADTYSFGGNHAPVGSLSSISACCGGAIQVALSYTDPDNDTLLYDFWYKYPSGPLWHYGFPNYIYDGGIVDLPLQFDSLGHEPVELYCNITDYIHIVRDSTFIDYTSVKNPDTNPLPTAFTVSASPNPFNSTTMVNFSIPTPSPVDLTVFDASGREITHKSLGSLSVGNHRFALTPNEIGTAAGIRFVRLQAGNVSRSVKVVYLK